MCLSRNLARKYFQVLLNFGLVFGFCYGKSLNENEFGTEKTDSADSNGNSNSEALKIAAQCFMLGVAVVLLIIAVRYRVRQCQQKRRESQADRQNVSVIIAIPIRSSNAGSIPEAQPPPGYDIIIQPPPSYYEATCSSKSQTNEDKPTTD